MGQVSIPWTSFNCGELSPLIEGRSDMAQYMKGGKTMLNFIPTVQGPMVRRGGTRFIGNPRIPNQPSVLIRFSRSQTESYVLSFSDQRLRFYFNGGLVVDGTGAPYEVPTPYTQADLFDVNGSPRIQAAESADVIYLAHPAYPPQVLSFLGPNNWTLAPFVNVDGPWQDTNPDLASKVYVSSGSFTIGSGVTLTASKNIFKQGMVGGLMRLHQQDLTTVKPWAPGQRTPVVQVGVLRRSGFCTYQCVSASPGQAPTGGTTLEFVQTGGNTLVHTQGNAWDGDQSTTIDPVGTSSYYSTGMEWSYQDCGYGVIQITGYISPTQVTGTVLRQLPQSLIGSAGATNIWELGAWSNDQGFPACVTFFRNRLTFLGGAGGQNRFWCSVSADYTNFADHIFWEVTQEAAVTGACQSDQVNSIVYVSPAENMLIGTTGGEFIVGPQSISDPFGPENFQVALQSQYGGRAVAALRVQQYTLFVTKNGRFVRESSFAFTAGPSGAYVSNDLTVLSEHITEGGIIAMAWAKNPYTIVWMVLGNGDLISFVYNPEQEVKNWERHDVAGNVVGICVVPSGTGDWDDVYIEVGHAIDDSGDFRYSIERIEQPFANLPGDRLQDAFYVDCGLTLNNTQGMTLQPGTGATVAGQTGVQFTVPNPLFKTSDVGRYIHFDYTTPATGDDGLPYQAPQRAVALITEVDSSQVVLATIDAPWPGLNTCAATDWRLTVTQVFGLADWFGQTVSLLCDGAVIPDIVYPDSGIIPLPQPASVIQAGIKSPAVFQTMKLQGVAGDRTGNSQGKLGRIVRVSVRVKDTRGLEIGSEIDDLEFQDERPTVTTDDSPPPLITGEYPDKDGRINFNGDWNRTGRVMVRAQQPLPMTVCSLAVLGDVEEDS